MSSDASTPNASDGGNSGTTPPAGQSEFTPITSQDDLNKIITQRIERERAKFADYDAIKAKAEQVDQLEEASKSEAQRLAERAEKAEGTATETQARLVRLEVILDKAPDDATMADVRRLVGLSKRLVGDTREAIEADADELLETFRPSGAGSTEVPSMDLGTRGGSPMPLNGDPLEAALRKTLGIS